MSNYLISLIRTWVPVGVGAVLAWLATRGLNLDVEAQGGLVTFITAAAIAVYYAIIRKLEERFPALGRWLLGLGVSKTPVYAAPDATVRVDGVQKR